MRSHDGKETCLRGLKQGGSMPCVLDVDISVHGPDTTAANVNKKKKKGRGITLTDYVCLFLFLRLCSSSKPPLMYIENFCLHLFIV